MKENCISMAIVKGLYSDFKLNSNLSPKDFYFAVNSFLSFGSYGLKDSILIFNSSSDYEKEGIKDILLRIININNNFLKEVENGKIKKNKYIKPLTQNKLWGDTFKGYLKDFADI